MELKCPGCGRPEVHKMCPAWGTPMYMSGALFTKEHEVQFYEERQKALGALCRRMNVQESPQVDQSPTSGE